jgi:hypothetical protein
MRGGPPRLCRGRRGRPAGQCAAAGPGRSRCGGSRHPARPPRRSGRPAAGRNAVRGPTSTAAGASGPRRPGRTPRRSARRTGTAAPRPADAGADARPGWRGFGDQAGVRGVRRSSPGRVPAVAVAVRISSRHTVTSAPSAATSPRRSSSANRNRPDSSRTASLVHSALSRDSNRGRTSRSRPPSRPDNGEATMLRTRSCARERSRPTPSSRPASSAPQPSRSPRSCTLPREVRRRSRPSPAACSRSAPGQASSRSREASVAWDDEGAGGVGMAASIPTITPDVCPALLR